MRTLLLTDTDRKAKAQFNKLLWETASVLTIRDGHSMKGTGPDLKTNRAAPPSTFHLPFLPQPLSPLTKEEEEEEAGGGRKRKDKLDTPYKRLQSQDQGHIQKWSTVVASVMLIACLVAFADPL